MDALWDLSCSSLHIPHALPFAVDPPSWGDVPVLARHTWALGTLGAADVVEAVAVVLLFVEVVGSGHSAPMNGGACVGKTLVIPFLGRRQKSKHTGQPVTE